jgi:hypothetical protein
MSDRPLFQNADEQEAIYAPQQLPEDTRAKEAANLDDARRGSRCQRRHVGPDRWRCEHGCGWRRTQRDRSGGRRECGRRWSRRDPARSSGLSATHELASDTSNLKPSRGGWISQIHAPLADSADPTLCYVPVLDERTARTHALTVAIRTPAGSTSASSSCSAQPYGKSVGLSLAVAKKPKIRRTQHAYISR